MDLSAFCTMMHLSEMVRSKGTKDGVSSIKASLNMILATGFFRHFLLVMTISFIAEMKMLFLSCACRGFGRAGAFCPKQSFAI